MQIDKFHIMTGRFLSIISALFLFGYFHNGFLLFYGIRLPFRRASKGTRDIGNHDIAVVNHPLVPVFIIYRNVYKSQH